MHKQILLVDYENVGSVSLEAVPTYALVVCFIGALQKTVPIALLDAATRFGERFKVTRIEGQGRNALDFHIAFYLGEYLSADASAEAIILSKDTGFDPLVKHLRRRRFNVRRVSSIPEALRSPAIAEKSPPVELVVKWLGAMQPQARPRKRKGLLAHTNNHFQKTLRAPEVAAIVDRLFAEKKVTDVNGALEYEL